MSASQHLLRPAIKAAGLPQRGPDILQREEALFPGNVQSLEGEFISEPMDDTPPVLTLDKLQGGFASDDLTPLNSAAWLAGRVEPEESGDKAVINKLLKDLIKARPLKELDIYTQAYVEAAFSLVLLGDVKGGRSALEPIATKYAKPFGDSYLAAFYLAQMGDPSGYPGFLETLHGDTGHYRLMAARHLYGFQPFAGQKVKKVTVDPLGELVKALQDSSPYVREEVPSLLYQFNPPNLRALLEPVAKNDSSEDVRQAAQHVIQHLDEAK